MTEKYQRYHGYDPLQRLDISKPIKKDFGPDDSPYFELDSFDGLFLAKRRDDFTKKQVYDAHPVSTLLCAKCGSDHLGIGVGSHLTVAKCWSCKTELVIHDG